MRQLVIIGLLGLLALGVCPSEGRADPAASSQDGPGTRIGGFFRELVGYLKRSDRLEVGDVAPDFELVPLRFYDFRLEGEPNAAGGAQRGVRLSAFRGVRPVALIFGSYT